MNTDSVDCRRVECPLPVGAPVPAPGDFCWGDEYKPGVRHLYIRIPGSSASGFDALECVCGPDPGIERQWGWDGDLERPTLVPSILNPGEWHGHMVAGRMVSC